MMWPLLKKALFTLDPETAHALSKSYLKLAPAQKISGKIYKNTLFQTLNPVGLAAGFDKNAEILKALPQFGFGYAEIGTVTPKPQGGNPKPRLFRDPQQKALFNRMGFNNLGATLVAKNLEDQKKQLPHGFSVGVNIGKNKHTSESDAHLDYQKCTLSFLDLADYLVINVSSPNTPGLRNLQSHELLKPILHSTQNALSKTNRKIPLLVKLAPELAEENHPHDENLTQLVQFLELQGVNGVILTNTLAGTQIYEGVEYHGGWSGPVLNQLSKKSLSIVRESTSLPVISVGGIESVETAVERMQMGATLIQIYTSWIYQGPYFPKKLAKTLQKLPI